MSLKEWLEGKKAKVEIERKKLVEESQQKRDRKKRESLRKAQGRTPGAIRDLQMGYTSKMSIWAVMKSTWIRRRYERKQKK